MTRSYVAKKEQSSHKVPAQFNMKRGGHGSGNWGDMADEIEEGQQVFHEGAKAKYEPADVGYSKLMTVKSNDSDKSDTTSDTTSTTSSSDA